MTNRLRVLARFVPKGTILADIGSHHGLLPIYLYQKGNIARGFATDNKKKSLAMAQLNVAAHNLSEVIQVRLGDGLQVLAPGEAQVLVLAGMGGCLIKDILEKRLDVVQHSQRVILQPYLHHKELRMLLHSVGFKIVEEEMTLENGRFYTTIAAEPGTEKCYDEEEYVYGRINLEKKELVLKEYGLKEKERIEGLLKELAALPKSENVANRTREMEQALEQVVKMLKNRFNY
eukprot:TRINITY_DN15453_c0_g1_i1.p1 TRINITY_DN15453_c0_g1~~TRINITY_DN15453_c0_g1_i1.p1  ORF type:complete len:252 (+),score=40.30 TRINITY_DN15453_c0_g1_i1:62-757(+)